MGGIRAEITVESPPDCPTARASAGGGTVTSISKSVPVDPDTPVTEEFVLDADPGVDPTAERAEEPSLRTVFDYGSERVYRFERPQDRTCFCECIEAFGCPVQAVRSADGRLTVTFHAPDEKTLRAVVSRLDKGWSGVSVRRLLRSKGKGAAEGDLVFVDRSDLTDRQREVLEAAHEMGYFAYPKRANAEAVAAELDLHPSTFAEHVAAAQRKLLGAILS